MNGSDIIKWLKGHPLASAAGCGAIAAIAVFALRFGHLTVLESQAQTLDEQLTKMEHNTRYATTLERDKERLRTSLDRIERGSMNPETKAENLDYFYKLEQRGNLRLTRVTQLSLETGYSTAKGAPKYEHWVPLQFEIEARGSFADTIRFLELLHRDRYFVRVNSLDVRPASEAGIGSAVPQLFVKLHFSVLSHAKEGSKR